MPRARIFVVGCLTLAFALLASGCAPAVSITTEETQELVEPLFVTDEEALEAATESYMNFRQLVDEVFHDGGADPERIALVAKGEAMTDVIDSANALRAEGSRLTGATAIDTVRLQSYSRSPKATIVIYACQDVSQTDLIDSNGTSTVDSGRRDKIPRQVTLVAGTSAPLIVSRDDLWTGQDFCN